MFIILIQQFYWLSVCIDGYSAMNTCTSCASKCIKLCKYDTDLSIFKATKSLNYVRIVVLGSLLESSKGRTTLLLVIYPISKQMATMSLYHVKSTDV